MGATENGNGCERIESDTINCPIHWDEQLRWLRPVVAARLCEPQGVDEVLQEVALQTVRQPANWAAVVDRPGWLYRVAIRQCLLYRRKHGRQRKLLHRYAERQATAGQTLSDPLSWLLAGERLALVRQAIARLQTRDAEFLLLKYTQNCSYVEIAGQLGMSVAAVESRLHRARERLRRELHQLDPQNRGCDDTE